MKLFGLDLPFLDSFNDWIQSLNPRIDVKKKNGNTITTISTTDGKATIVTGPEGIVDVRSIGFDRNVPMDSREVAGIGTSNTSQLDEIRKSVPNKPGRMKITVATAGYDSFYVGGGTAAAVMLSPEFEQYLLGQMRTILVDQGRIPQCSTNEYDEETIVRDFAYLMQASDFVNRFLMAPMDGSDIHVYTGKVSLGPNEEDCDGSVLEQDTLFIVHLMEHRKDSEEEHPLMMGVVLSNSMSTWKENIELNGDIAESIMSDRYEAVTHLLIQMMDNDFRLPTNKILIEHATFRSSDGKNTEGWRKLQTKKNDILSGDIDFAVTFARDAALSSVPGLVAFSLASHYFGEQVTIIEKESGVTLHYPDHWLETKRIVKRFDRLRPYLIKEIADEFEID